MSLFHLISSISPIFSTFFNSVLGAVVLISNPKRSENRWFFFFTVFISLWAFGCFIQSTFMAISINVQADRLIYFAAILTSARYVTIPNSGWYLFVVAFSILSLQSIYLLWKSYKSAGKTTTLYILLAYCFLAIAGAAYFGLSLGLTQSPLIANMLNLISSIMSTLYGFMMAYAILKHDLMDIRLVITKSVAIIITLLLIISTMLVPQIVNLPLFLSASITVGIAIFWAFLGKSTIRAIQTPLEKKWIKDQYDSSDALNKLTRNLSPVNTREDAFECVANLIQDTIEIKKIDVVIFLDKEFRQQVRYQFNFGKDKEQLEIRRFGVGGFRLGCLTLVKTRNSLK